jgi:hypothetical protein
LAQAEEWALGLGAVWKEWAQQRVDLRKEGVAEAMAQARVKSAARLPQAA